MSTKIRPELPLSAINLIEQFIKEEDLKSFSELEHHQMRDLLSEISYDANCFAYTAEFGLLSDLISDIFNRQYNDSKAYGLIEEAFIECWLSCINSAFKEAEERLKQDLEDEFDPSYYRTMNDGFLLNSYSDKHGI